MLLSLSIENVAVIEKLNIEFEGGLGVLTGETGAGKSIIIDSINMTLGERTAKDLIRTGAERASVRALFLVDGKVAQKLAEFGIEIEDNQLLISRDLYQDKRSVFRVNGELAPALTVKAIAPMLINIYGQHDSQSLLQPGQHISILDEFINNDILAEYKGIYEKTKELEREIGSLTLSDEELRQKRDFYAYALDELNAADLQPGEDDRLAERKTALDNAETIMKNIDGAYDGLYGTDGVCDRLYAAASQIMNALKFEGRLQTVYDTVQNALIELKEISGDVRQLRDVCDYDEGTLPQIEARLNTIYDLKRKYGRTIEEILSYKEKIVDELDKLMTNEDRIEKLNLELTETREQLQSVGARLTSLRREGGDMLRGKITEELQALDMQEVNFKVRIEPVEPTSSGLDEVEFLISPNAGEDLKPLAKIASGGELSRIMLALKTVLCGIDDAGVMIFDEIDAGVSGRAAQRIAEKLYAISTRKQTLCITHLSQIAAMADHHFLIEKNTDINENSTKTTVKRLEGEERLEEIARIIGGVKVTDLTLQTAAQMLAQAMEKKQ